MPVLDAFCRGYQKLYHHGHPEEAKLVELHGKDDKSEFLRAYFDHEYDKGVQMIERFTSITPEWKQGRILDFGCGAGGLTLRIREHCQETVGIDLDAQKLDFAREEAARRNIDKVEFICYEGGDVPLPDHSFDCIFCVDVVEHLPTPEKFIQDFRRLLKPGGWLLVSFGPPWRHAHGKHMWAKLPGWWTHLLFPQSVVMRVAGFESQTTYEELGMFRLTVGKYEKIMKKSGFETIFHENKINRVAKPLKNIPGLREYFISEVVGVYRNPA